MTIKAVKARHPHTMLLVSFEEVSRIDSKTTLAYARDEDTYYIIPEKDVASRYEGQEPREI